ncbi:MAG: M14 metallopeptidase family protein [Bryobacteraceae bacterium]
MKLLLPLLLAASAFAQVPTPESVLGHKPGDDFFLASYDESLGYFQKLAASTDKLKLVKVGQTTRKADWYIAIISSPENLRNLDKYKDTAKRLAWTRGLTDEQARALAKDGKAIVHIDGGLHATEVAHAQHTIQLAYNLVTGSTPEIRNILDNVVLVLWFSINPDGQNMMVKWYRSNLGTPYEVSPMMELYQEYIGHDNNRDGYMNNMIESQTVTRQMLEWYPQVVYNHHQTAPFPARIWIPPFSDPISSNVHPLMWRWVNVFGTSMAAYLDEHEMPGSMHRGRFDDWYPGFIDHVNSYRNTISFLTETALYRYATPHFYTIDEFPKEKQDLRTEVFYSSPWKGGWWRVGDAVRYMLGASMAVLDTAAKYREDIQYNRYQAGRDIIKRFTNDPPYAYVIPRDQRDPATAAILAEKVMIDGIEVHTATRPFSANGIQYAAGSWVILMDQPFSALVKDLFEAQKYPDLRQGPGGPPELPYDVTGWTLPMQMGVEVAAVATPVSADQRAGLRKLDQPVSVPGTLSGTGASFKMSRQTNGAYQAINEVLAGGGKVSFTKGSDEVAIDFDRAKLDAIAQKTGVMVTAGAAGTNAYAVKAPRIGLYRPYTASIDEGWTRWILENYKFNFVSLYNADVQAGRLRDRFDAIVLADIGSRQIMDGFAHGTVPEQYAGGIGDVGVEKLREFVDAGGTLVTFSASTLFAIDKFNLPVTNVLATVKPTEFFCSGCLLKVELKDASHPLVAGLPAQPIVMSERSPAFEAKSGFHGVILASYPKERNPLASGYLLGPHKIQGKAAALDVAYGKGRIVLLGFRPQWRGQSHGTYKFFFNALYYNGSAAPAETSAAPRGPATTWRTQAEAAKGELAKLVEQNKAFHTAKGAKANEEGKKLEAGIDAFQRDRLPALEDLRQAVEDAATARKFAEFGAQLRRMSVDVRSKDLSGAKLAELFEQFKLTQVP